MEKVKDALWDAWSDLCCAAWAFERFASRHMVISSAIITTVFCAAGLALGAWLIITFP